MVGAASGYCAAVLAATGVDVTSIDDPDADAGADGDRNFDLILVDGAVERVPQALVDRLVEGGRLGAALSGNGVSRLVVGHAAAGRIGLRTIADADVPALSHDVRPRAFTF